MTASMIELYCSSCLTLVIVLTILSIITLTILLFIKKFARKNKIKIVAALIISIIIGITSVAGLIIYLQSQNGEISYHTTYSLEIISNNNDTFELIFPLLTGFKIESNNTGSRSETLTDYILDCMYTLSLNGNGNSKIIYSNETTYNYFNKFALLIQGTGKLSLFGETFNYTHNLIGLSTESFKNRTSEYEHRVFIYSTQDLFINFRASLIFNNTKHSFYDYSEEFTINTKITPGWNLVNVTNKETGND